VETFYGRIWNGGDLAAALTLLTDAFVFRGSLGTELQGRNEFLAYVCAVRFALADYHCDILACVTKGDRAFAPMRFSGRHVEVFRGFPPTGKPVHWCGAAWFQFEGPVIANLWGLGDLHGLEAVLHANQAAGLGGGTSAARRRRSAPPVGACPADGWRTGHRASVAPAPGAGRGGAGAKRGLERGRLLQLAGGEWIRQ
jgi:predicted ester cyclase